ncbi:MAG: Ger(x)C family spore germination protein [Bacillota bacterium]
MPTVSRFAWALVLCSVLLAGCWDIREPEELVHVQVLGFDVDEEGNYLVIAQSPMPQAAMTQSDKGGGGGGAAQPFLTQSEKGQTLSQALQNLHRVMTRELSLGHVRVILLSERLAREGIDPVVDMVTRERQLRLLAGIAVVEGDLDKLMRAQFPPESIPATGIGRMINTFGRRMAVSTSEPLLIKVVEYLRPGQDILLPRVRVTTAEPESKSTEMPGTPPMDMFGSAAFCGPRLVGWMGERETRGWNWVKTRNRRGLLLVELPGGCLASLLVVTSSATVEPVVDSREVRMKVKVQMGVSLTEVSGPAGIVPDLNLTDEETVLLIRRRLSEVVRNDIEMALAKAQELGSDVFGFGNLLYRKHPELWAEVAGRWEDIFRRLPVEITVETSLCRPGFIMNTLRTR